MTEKINYWFRRFVQEQEGQSTTEYMLLIGVIALGIIVAGIAFIKPFKGGVGELAKKFKEALSSGNSDVLGKGLN